MIDIQAFLTNFCSFPCLPKSVTTAAAEHFSFSSFYAYIVTLFFCHSCLAHKKREASERMENGMSKNIINHPHVRISIHKSTLLNEAKKERGRTALSSWCTQCEEKREFLWERRKDRKRWMNVERVQIFLIYFFSFLLKYTHTTRNSCSQNIKNCDSSRAICSSIFLGILKFMKFLLVLLFGIFARLKMLSWIENFVECFEVRDSFIKVKRMSDKLEFKIFIDMPYSFCTQKKKSFNKLTFRLRNT